MRSKGRCNASSTGKARSTLARAATVALCLLLFPLAAVSGCGTAPETPRSDAPASFLVGGVAVDEPDTELWLDRLVDLGFNTVHLTLYTRQGRWDRAELESRAEEDWIVPEVRAAKKRGLRVVLILRLALEHALPENEFLWHGMVMPQDAEERRRWFEAYGDWVVSWARVAEREGIDVFGIGSELNALTATLPVTELPELEAYYLDDEKQLEERQRLAASAEGQRDEVVLGQLGGGNGDHDSLLSYVDARTARHRAWALDITCDRNLSCMNERRAALEQEWRRLITSVRDVFSGQVTYAANFDQYTKVGFWDALDLIGINAYFPLRSALQPELDVPSLEPVFEESWHRVWEKIESFRAEQDLSEKPVLFTELGYTYRADSTIEPWAAQGFGIVKSDSGDELVLWQQKPVELRERALAVQALRRVVTEEKLPLAGLLYWKLSTVAEHRDVEPFVLLLDEQSQDPLLPELVRFLEPHPSE